MCKITKKKKENMQTFYQNVSNIYIHIVKFALSQGIENRNCKLSTKNSNQLIF